MSAARRVPVASPRPLLTLAALACAGMLLAGCSGESTNDTSGSSGERVVREEDLDLGGEDAEAAKVEKTAVSLADGRAVESARLAEFVVDPSTVDPAMQQGCTPAGTMVSPDELSRVFSDEDPKLVAMRIAGASACRVYGTAADPSKLTLTVLIFASPAKAKAFAASVHARASRNGTNLFDGTSTFSSATTIDGHPEILTSLFKVKRDSPDQSITAVTAYGSAVAYTFTSPAAGQVPATKARIARLFDAQRDALAKFEPKTLEQLLGQRIDPTGVAKLTLARPSIGKPKKQESEIVRVWGPNAALHRQTWAKGLAKAFKRADVDVMADGGSSVYRTGSVRQAKRLLDDFQKTVTETQYDAFHTPKGLPDARCYQIKATLVNSPIGGLLAPNYCQVRFGRYIAETSGTTADQAENRVSAQYLVLQRALGA